MEVLLSRVTSSIIAAFSITNTEARITRRSDERTSLSYPCLTDYVNIKPPPVAGDDASPSRVGRPLPLPGRRCRLPAAQALACGCSEEKTARAGVTFNIGLDPLTRYESCGWWIIQGAAQGR